MQAHDFLPPPVFLAGAWCIQLFAAYAEPEALAARDYWIDAGAPKVGRTVTLVEEGKRAFESRCAACHGKRGLGNGPAAPYLLTKPRDFSSATFKLRTTMDFPTDEDLFRTITVGFPAYGMPSFFYLPESLRWGLVYYVKDLGRTGLQERIEGDLVYEALNIHPEDVTPALEAEFGDRLNEIRTKSEEIAQYRFEAEELAPLPAASPERPWNLDAGRAVYLRYECGKCHGDAGHGDGPTAETLRNDDGTRAYARDFALSRWYFKGGERVQDIVRVLITGLAGAPMPSFDRGPEYRDELWQLGHYVKSLAATEEDR